MDDKTTPIQRLFNGWRAHFSWVQNLYKNWMKELGKLLVQEKLKQLAYYHVATLLPKASPEEIAPLVVEIVNRVPAEEIASLSKRVGEQKLKVMVIPSLVQSKGLWLPLSAELLVLVEAAFKDVLRARETTN